MRKGMLRKCIFKFRAPRAIYNLPYITHLFSFSLSLSLCVCVCVCL